MALTINKKRPVEESPVGVGVRMPKRIRLKLPKSSSSRSTSSSSREASNDKTLPTKVVETPTGETIEATETFPWYIKRDPTKHWKTSTFDLAYPHLHHTHVDQLTYTWAYERCPYRPEVFRPTCWPDAPEDTIRKDLFAHPTHREVAWSGPWAERKLAAEVARYDRVKWFWLFNDGWAYVPGWDDKHRYAARRFRREMESPWVVTWLRELIGEGEVAKILAHMEEKERKDVAKLS